MSGITIVQKTGQYSGPTSVPVNSRGTIQSSVAFGSNNVSGNVIIAILTIANDNTAGIRTFLPYLNDTLGNKYEQICWVDGGNQSGGAIGIFIAKNILPGANTVTGGSVWTTIPFSACTLDACIMVAEYNGFGTDPFYSGVATHQYGGSGNSPIDLFIFTSGGVAGITFSGPSGGGGIGTDAGVAAAVISGQGFDYCVGGVRAYNNNENLPVASLSQLNPFTQSQQVVRSDVGDFSYFWDSAPTATGVPYPIIYGSSTALYPFKIRYQFYTALSVMESADSRRSIQAPPTVSMDLPFDPVNIANSNVLRAAYASALGEFATNRYLTIDRLYDNMSLDSDVFTAREGDLTVYTVNWKTSQVAANGNLFEIATLTAPMTNVATVANFSSTVGMPIFSLPTITFDIQIDDEIMTVTAYSTSATVTRGARGTTAAAHLSAAVVSLASGNPFPKITGGCLGQYPFDNMVRYRTIKVKSPFGPKFTFAEYGAGLTNFPTRGLGAWRFEETLLSEADIAVRVAHYVSNWGNRFSFDYTDEDGTVYHNVYYKNPTLEVSYDFYNDSKVTLELMEMKS